MLEAANASNGAAGRRGEAESSSSSTPVAGEKRSGEETNFQSGSEDKASKKMKKDKQDTDTSGNFGFFFQLQGGIFVKRVFN